MLSSVKDFIRSFLENHDVPFLTEAFLKRRNKIILERLKHNSTLSYDEIEKLVSEFYFKIFGRELNWENPQTFNEKIQVSERYDKDPRKTLLADKYLVRDWVKNIIGEKYLIPLLGVYDNADEIDFEKLPDKCVLKCNHDSGSVVIWDKSKRQNINRIKLKLNNCLKINYAWMFFEMNYKDIQPKIIVEKFIGDNVNDYKFVCFDGVPYYCWVDVNRFIDHRRNFYNMNWELQPFQMLYKNYESDVKKPEAFDEMRDLASKLSKDFRHVRADFYYVNQKIYFGEMTFSSEGGTGVFTPDEWDYKIGELWKFDNSLRTKERAKNLKP